MLVSAPVIEHYSELCQSLTSKNVLRGKYLISLIVRNITTMRQRRGIMWPGEVFRQTFFRNYVIIFRDISNLRDIIRIQNRQNKSCIKVWLVKQTISLIIVEYIVIESKTLYDRSCCLVDAQLMPIYVVLRLEHVGESKGDNFGRE